MGKANIAEWLETFSWKRVPTPRRIREVPLNGKNVHNPRRTLICHVWWGFWSWMVLFSAWAGSSRLHGPESSTPEMDTFLTTFVVWKCCICTGQKPSSIMFKTKKCWNSQAASLCQHPGHVSNRFPRQRRGLDHLHWLSTELMNPGLFQWSETSGALTASGGALDLQRSENDKRTEEEKESSGPVIVSSTTLIRRKENGLLMETHRPAHAYVSTSTTASVGLWKQGNNAASAVRGDLASITALLPLNRSSPKSGA